jgi:hypothetical protein
MKPLTPKIVMKRIAEKVKQMENLRYEIEGIKFRCSHEWEYESDPSGNNDSGYYCRACQTTKRRI